ncbi:MAG: BatA and WFA domain-containing protein [Ignavibacteriales bacterium]|nr:MAG: BatA and WFA domain-containing protein [Ignavibacteriales bacterium]
MIFLNPAILFGLLAASIPVLIHLFNLRKLKKIEFSTLAFLKELQKNKIRKIKLKQWLLLALRVLIILFLVMAFARPTLEGLAIGGTTSAAKTSAVFILDDSFSMSVVDNNGSYFNQAKESVVKLLSNLQEGDEAALFLTSSKQNEIKFSNDIGGIINSVRGLSASYGSGYLEECLLKAATLLNESKNFNKEIYIISDFQKSTLNKYESASVINELADEKIRLYLIKFNEKPVNNIAVTEFKTETQIFEKGKPVSFTATIKNFSGNEISNNVASIFSSGERIAQQSFSIASGESLTLNIEAQVNTSGFVETFIEIDDDDILQDNKRYLTLDIPEVIPVIIFYQQEQDTKFIELALNVPGSSTSIKIEKRNINQIASVNLNNYKTVILCGNISGSNLQKIKSYVENGGGLFIIPASQTTALEYSSMLSGLNIQAGVAASGKIDDNSNPVKFDKIEFQHPVFADLFPDEKKNKIDSPEIYFHLKMSSAINNLPLITLDDNSVFLSESVLGKGKIFVFTSAPVLSWTNLPLKGIFVPLIYKSVSYLASNGKTVEEKFVGQEIQVKNYLQNSPILKITKPDKTDEVINQNANVFEQTTLPGNYTVTGNEVIDKFSINTDPVESDIKYLSESEIETYIASTKFGGKSFLLNINDDPVQAVVQSRFGSELWRYFVLIALLLAITETLVARSSKKDLLSLNETK